MSCPCADVPLINTPFRLTFSKAALFENRLCLTIRGSTFPNSELRRLPTHLKQREKTPQDRSRLDDGDDVRGDELCTSPWWWSSIYDVAV